MIFLRNEFVIYSKSVYYK